MIRRVIALLSVALVGAVLPAGNVAAATGGVALNDGHGWQRQLSTPLFSLGRIAPGWHDSRTLDVRNDSASTADAWVDVTNVVERENGCVAAEAVVDTTCGGDQGELGEALQLQVFDDANPSPVWTGPLADVTSPVVVATRLGSGASTAVRLVISLPFSTGNIVESDQVGFDLHVGLDQSSNPSAVLGESVSRSGGPSASVAGATLPSGSSALAFTGLEVDGLIALAALALTVGAAVLLAERRTRRTRRTSAATT